MRKFLKIPHVFPALVVLLCVDGDDLRVMSGRQETRPLRILLHDLSKGEMVLPPGGHIERDILLYNLPQLLFTPHFQETSVQTRHSGRGWGQVGSGGGSGGVRWGSV